MSKAIVFDIETYRPDWRVRRTRREALDPAKNTIITLGFFDGKQFSIFPTIENLKDERLVVQFFLSKLEEFEGSAFVGYNILHFDIPFLVYKSELIGRNFEVTSLKPFDLYWILPYCLHNTPTGKDFLGRFSHFGNLWKFSYVVEHILGEQPNPFSNTDIFQLWEMKRFKDIEKHLKLDLVHTFSFLESPLIGEALDHIKKQNFDKSHCEDSCPFQQPLQKTSHKALSYCTLSRDHVLNERGLSAIDVIDCPLPGWDVSWVPCCLE